MEDATGKILVLGVGNTLLTDEGVGVHALDALGRDLTEDERARVTLIDGGTLSFTLAAPICDCDGVIVLDTAALNALPGTVRSFEGAEMDSFLATGPKTSVHEVSLTEVLGMALAQDRLPARRILIGIQPQTLGWGTEPTPEVAAAIPQVVALARAKLAEWSP